jgi:CheY-like chemotaxis protein
MMTKILVVDDEPDVELLFNQKFRKEIKAAEFSFHFAFSGKEALAFLRTLQPLDLVLVLSDINMPGMTGLELLEIIRTDFPDLRVMMITAYGDDNNYRKAMQLGAYDFMTKPVDFARVKEKILEVKSGK